MASLYEMMAAAEHKAQNKAAANPLQSGAAALAGGFTKGFDTRFGNESAADLQTKQLQQAMAILQQKEQVEKLKRQALSDRVLRQELVKMGYLDPQEYRHQEFSDIGKQDVSEKDQVNTNASVVAAILSGKGQDAQNRKIPSEHKENDKTMEIVGGDIRVKQKKEKSVSAQDRFREDVNRARRGEITRDELKNEYPDKGDAIDKILGSLPDLRERQVPLNPKFQEDFGIMGRVRSWLDENRAVLNPVTKSVIEHDLKTPDDFINLLHERQRGTLPQEIDFKAILEAFGISQKHLENGNFPPEVKTVSQAIEYLVRTR
jgi:hypothetical protein